MSAGVLFVDKPAGPTSFDVVKQIRRRLKIAKVGHAGTLDPAATGLLIVLLDDATKFQRFITEGTKTYSGVLRLGVTTDSDDTTGRVIEEKPVPDLSSAELDALIRRFSGRLNQVPPQVSAVKVDGRRAYDLSRKGERTELAPREVEVFGLELVQAQPGSIHYTVSCSKGFYVRSLARDIGEYLGCGGAADSIRRESTCGVHLSKACALSQLLELRPEELPIHKVTEILSDLSVVDCTEEEYRSLLQGRNDALRATASRSPSPSEVILEVVGGGVAGMLSRPNPAGERTVEFLIPGVL